VRLEINSGQHQVCDLRNCSPIWTQTKNLPDYFSQSAPVAIRTH